MITLNDYFMGHDKDPRYADELDSTKYNNAVILVSKINRLEDLFPKFYFKVKSGWRPSLYNSTIKNASPKSNHIICRAIDIEDVDNLLSNYLKENVQILINIGLCMENPDFTVGWCHLQDVMPRSGRRIFNP